MAKSSRFYTPGTVKLNFRIGNVGAVKDGLTLKQARENAAGGVLKEPAMIRLQEGIEKLVRDRAEGRLLKELKESLTLVEKAIKNDITRYTAIIASVITEQRSSTLGKPTRFGVDATKDLNKTDSSGRRVRIRNAFKSAIISGDTDTSFGDQVMWPALTKRWIKQKGGDTKFFAGLSGRLFFNLRVSDAYTKLFDPRVVLRSRYTYTGRGTNKVRGDRFATLTVSFSQNRFGFASYIQYWSQQNNDFTKNEDTLIDRLFTQESIANKILGRYKGGQKKRPWFGFLARFWFRNRMPQVAEIAFDRHIGRLMRKDL